MSLAHGVRTLAGVVLRAATLTVATVTIATVAAATTAATTGTAPGTAAAPTVTITPGIQHHQREPRTGPSTTAECEQAIGIACYDPVQADGVGPVRGPGAEHPRHRVARITARDGEEHAAVRPVEPGQHQDLGPGPQVAQCVGDAGLEDQPGRRRTLVGLHGGLGHLGQR